MASDKCKVCNKRDRDVTCTHTDCPNQKKVDTVIVAGVAILAITVLITAVLSRVLDF